MKFDRNTIIGLVLMLALVIGFSWFNTPSPEEMKERQRLDSLARAEAEVHLENETKKKTEQKQVETQAFTNDSAKTAYLQGKFGILSKAASGEEKRIKVVNNKLELEFSTKGGMIASATLMDGYKRYKDKQPVQLWVDSLSKMKISMNVAEKGRFSTDYFFFTPGATQVDARSGAQDLTMRLETGIEGKYLELVYHIEPDSYEIPCTINVVGLGNELALAAADMKFEWLAVGHANEKGISAERSKCSIYFRENEEGRDYLRETGDDVKKTEKAVHWMAFKQDYFTTAVIADQHFKAGADLAVATLTDSSTTKRYYANLALPLSGESANTNLRFYFGPNDYKELNALNVEEFDRIIDYGWSIIGIINKYVVRPIFWFFSSWIGSFGLIILLVTIIIKTVLFPVTWKNFLSSAKMRVLKPEIDEINKKYENKPESALEKQQAIMGLYRKTGVNPFAGCIPVLLQMPILYAMFRFFPAEIVLRGESFLWADDLAAYDSIFSWSQHIPILSGIYGNHISGFTLLMAASTFVYTKMSMGAQPQMTQPGMPNMKVMMNLFTIMMLFFFNNMPSGLSMYYFTANMISIGQMYVIKNYIIDEDAIRAKIEENKKKPKKKSGFAERLEQVQKEQQRKLNDKKKSLKK